jgi:hypothetical protein
MDEPVTDDEIDFETEIQRLARDLRRARGLLVAARRAMALARRYRAEDGPRGRRELACVTQALAWRSAARLARSRINAAGPGLARTAAPPAAGARKAAS